MHHLHPEPVVVQSCPSVSRLDHCIILQVLSVRVVVMQPAGPLVGKCRTLDQARAVMTFLDAASEKTLRSTVALTAARGRGKVPLP